MRGENERPFSLLPNIFNAKGMFYIVLLSLCCGHVDTILALSFVHACQNTKPVIIYPFSPYPNTSPYF